MSEWAGTKPLDVGSGRVCASFDATSAAWLSAGTPHSTHGFVELSAVPAFDEADRGDPGATRRHRLAMTSGEHAFLRVELAGGAPLLTPDCSDPERPRWFADGVEVVAEAPTDGERVRQAWRLGSNDQVVIRVRGALDRPALAEITEVDPPPPTGATTTMRAHGAVLDLETPTLPARAEIRIEPNPGRWIADGAGYRAELTVTDGSLTLEVRLGPARGGHETHADAGDATARRALAYIRGCTALRTGEHERTILTDHRLLPLSWTRDAYWQALALLVADAPGDRERVGDHLRWLWRRCQRPDGRWVRSHHADGRRKDLAFQADQQLYPVVELADYWRATGQLPAGVDWSPEVRRALDTALEELDATTGLIASAENAADDPVAAPYIASSQILLWYALARLAEMAATGVIGLDAAFLSELAQSVQAAFSRWIADGEGTWAYAVDGRGARIAYHDANDLPVALAPVLGFCDAADAGWRATMAFAFSEANPAFSIGPRSGLGSAHTRGPWTLGDIQAWVVARTTADDASAADALARLASVAFDDAMLPEAYSATLDPDVRVRHWFAWPGAALTALRLVDAAGALHDRLTARLP